jgi:hypothetical protein
VYVDDPDIAEHVFNWAHELVVTDRGPGCMLMRHTDVSGVGYHRHDCAYTMGLLAMVPSCSVCRSRAPSRRAVVSTARRAASSISAGRPVRKISSARP